MKRLALAFSLCIFLVPCAAKAQGMDAKFAAADENRDGFLSPQEFSAAFPSLKQNAFALIDANGDGRVSLAEWRAFTEKHGAFSPMPPPEK